MLCTSSIVDDTMFSQHGASGPQSSMTLCLGEVHQVAVPAGRQDNYLVEFIRMWHREWSQLSTIDLLYPPNERGETGRYTVITFVCLCVCLCALSPVFNSAVQAMYVCMFI